MAQVLRIELRGGEDTYPAVGTYEAVVSYTADGCNMVVEVILPDGGPIREVDAQDGMGEGFPMLWGSMPSIDFPEDWS